MRDADSDLITAFCTAAWSDEDRRRLKVAGLGDCSDQASFEAYMLLLACATWHKELTHQAGELRLTGDAEGVLRAVLSRRSRSPIINLIIMELQYLLGQTMHDIYAVHVWSEDNHVADALSRLDEGYEMPPECIGKHHKDVVRPRWRFLVL